MDSNSKNNITFKDEEFLKDFTKNIISIRKSKNFNQDQISKLLNINVNIIASLENGDLSKLENNVFVLGHIKTYLKWLNINYDMFLENINSNNKYKHKIPNKPIVLNLNFLKFLNIKFGKSTLIIFIIIFSIISSTILVFIWNNLLNKSVNLVSGPNYINKNISRDESENSTTIYSNEVEKHDTNTNNEELVTDEKNINVDVNDKDQPLLNNEINNSISSIVIYAINDSWIEIQDKNSNIIISKILNKGEQESINYEEGLKLITGNAGGIKIKINEVIIENIGENGEVKRNISLNYTNLLKINE